MDTQASVVKMAGFPPREQQVFSNPAGLLVEGHAKGGAKDVLVTEFHIFGTPHLTALLLVGIFSGLFFRLGCGSSARFWNGVWAGIFTLYGIGFWGFKLSDGFDWDWDLPLALCDVIYCFCWYCFFKPHPLLITLAAYWGLAGTLQALVTPDVSQEFPSVEFCLFFAGHGMIVVGIFFLIAHNWHSGLEGWRGLRDSVIGLLLYTLLVGVFNQFMGLNYAYLCRKPDGASILDFMGDWPNYVLGGLMVGILLFSALAPGMRILGSYRDKLIGEA